jgi:AhpD family alkylhydroperoxidase
MSVMIRLDYSTLSAPATHALFALEKAVKSLGFDEHISDLVRIRISQLNGCLLCLDMHVKEATLREERPLRLYHLTAWRESPLFSAKEKAALRWAELLTRPNEHGVTDEDYAEALEQFSEKELSDLTFVVVTINAWNRLGVAFRAPPGSYDKALGLDRANLR